MIECKREHGGERPDRHKLRRGDIPSMAAAAAVVCRGAVVVVLVHGAWLLHQIKEISEGFKEGRKKGRGEGLNLGKRRAHLAGVGGIQNPSHGEGSGASCRGREEHIWLEGRKKRRKGSSGVCCAPARAARTRRNRATYVAAATSRETEERRPLGWVGLGLMTTAPPEREVGRGAVGKREGRNQGEVTRGSGRKEMGAAAAGGGSGRSEMGVMGFHGLLGSGGLYNFFLPRPGTSTTLRRAQDEARHYHLSYQWRAQSKARRCYF